MIDKGQLERCEDFFRAWSRRRGLRLTHERRGILLAAASAGEHFDPDWMLRRIRRAGLHASRATLYRTLTLLTEAGILQQVLHGHKHMHYEYVFERSEHDHIVDLETGEVIEFDNREVVALRDAVCRAHGYRAVSHRLQITAVRQDDGGRRRKRGQNARR